MNTSAISLVDAINRSNELKRDRDVIVKAHAENLRVIDEELESIHTLLRQRESGLDVDKITLAKSVLYVEGRYDNGGGDTAWMMESVLAAIASGDARLREERPYVKNYDRFVRQGGWCRYFCTPRHGSIAFSIGLARNCRDRSLSNEEKEAAVYTIIHWPEIEKTFSH